MYDYLYLAFTALTVIVSILLIYFATHLIELITNFLLDNTIV